ncbi:MAG: hypothetical protein KDC39_13395 [Actinobacteria bacterium]|nr:hypothetical protein [Actinomycetota bacterium]
MNLTGFHLDLTEAAPKPKPKPKPDVPGSQEPGGGRAAGALARTAGFLRQALWLVLLSRRYREVRPTTAVLLAVAWVSAWGLLVCYTMVALLAPELSDRWSVAGQLWLVAHQVPISTAGGSITLLPIGLLVVPLLFWRRAASWLWRRQPRSWRRRDVVLCTAGSGAAALLVALLANPSATRATPLWATLAGCAVALGGIAWGRRRLRRRSGSVLHSDGVQTMPGAVAGGLATVIGILAVGAVLTCLIIVSDVSLFLPSGSLSQTMGLILIQLAYLPNLVLWAAAYATGTGVQVSGAGVLSPYENTIPALPDLPLLQALPATGPSWSALLPLAMLLCGVFGALIVQRRAPVRGLRHRLSRVPVLAGFTLAFWLLARPLSGGSLGDGRLDWIGPATATPWIAALLVGAGVTVWALFPTLAADARPLAADIRTRFGPRSSEEDQPGAAAGDQRPKIDV